MRHFLKLENFPLAEARTILARTAFFKKNRGSHEKFLDGQSWAMIFSKPSTRTRVSFEVAIREFGGSAMFLGVNDMQLGRGEPVRDTARVLARMTHGVVIRTFAQSDVEELAKFGDQPVINALTDEEHPCQILADIFTYEEKRGSIAGKKVAFIGDASCNVPRSLAFAAEIFGFDLVCGAPSNYSCDVKSPRVRNVASPTEAAKDADLLYTDVWVSMGKESETQQRLKDFQGYQINNDLLAVAKPDALVLHCLPAYRGKEITDEVVEARAQDIFDEAENRLHVQKAIIEWCVKG